MTCSKQNEVLRKTFWAWNRLCRKCFKTISRNHSQHLKHCFISRRFHTSPLIFELWSTSPDPTAVDYWSLRPLLTDKCCFQWLKTRRKDSSRVIHCVLTFLMFEQETWARTIKDLELPSIDISHFYPATCDWPELSRGWCLEKPKAMYVQRNVGVRSRNHPCRRKAISITHFEKVSVCSLTYPAWKTHSP